MANPFDPKPPRNYLLEAILGSDTPPLRPSSLFGSGRENTSFGNQSPFGLAPPPPPSPMRLAIADLLTKPAPPSPFFRSPPPIAPAPAPIYSPPLVKRRSYFSFHYADVTRSVNVRNAWRLQKKTGQDRTFFDSSLWEKSKITDPERLKSLITRSMKNISAVCVLAGSETFRRPFVRYEIARGIVDGRGLLTVHINGLRHIDTRTTDPLGPNPLDFMGIGRAENGAYYLYECNDYADIHGHTKWVWERYSDFRFPVRVPRWLRKPLTGEITLLSQGADEYDYADDGYNKIGAWIDRAAARAGY